MVTLSTVKYGVEINSSMARLIECRSHAGGEKFEKIFDTDIDLLNINMIDSGAALYFSIPEPEAIIKQINIGDNKLLDPDKRARFEMESSLLDKNDCYYYESYATEQDTERLAVAFNKTTIDKKVAWLNDHLKSPAGFKLRSLAMVSAYGKYFYRETGQMICLADIADDLISYVLLNNNIPIVLGAVHKSKGNSDNLILDFIATIRYQVLLQKNKGYSLPISRILISGIGANESLAERLADKIKIKTDLPRARKEFFSEETYSKAVSSMVGLGLTVEG